MSKIARKTAVIFGASSGLDQIAEFGSLALGVPTFTTDPAVIQSGAESTWIDGWFNAVIGSNSPAIEDMNAFCYVVAYQIAYNMQAGVPEYDTGTTYYIGSIVQSAGFLFVSLTNTNLGNALTSTANWAFLSQNGLITPNSVPQTAVVTTGNTMSWPNMTVPSGKTLTINSGAYFRGFGTNIVAGTFVIAGTSVIIN